MDEKVNKNRVITYIVLSLFLLSILYTQYFRVNLKLEKFKIDPVIETEVFYIPDVTTLKILAMGYPSFLSDLLLMRTLAYFLYHLFTDRIFAWLNVYLDRVVGLDPYNVDVYEWAMKVILYKQMITNEVLLESNAWAQRGLKYFPDNWRFYLQIGFNYFFEWDFKDEKEKKEIQRKALDYFMIAALLPGSELDPNFVTELYLRNNEKDMALFVAIQKYLNATDEEKKFLLRRIYFYVSKEAGLFLKEREIEWKENFPYVPSDFFVILGKKIDTKIPIDFAKEGIFKTLMGKFYD